MGGDVCWVWWRKVDEWARIIEEWVDETGQRGSVLTLYELVEGEGGRGAGMLFVSFFTFLFWVYIKGLADYWIDNRVPRPGCGNFTKSFGNIGEEGQGTSFWTGGSTGSEILLKCVTSSR